MIYFDNSATTIQKPKEVSEAVQYAIHHFGNGNRSFYTPALIANREVYKTRVELAKLTALENEMNVAFTSSSTESLNMVIHSLISHEDAVITTVYEHNSVLRPLYQTGCQISILECTPDGLLKYEDLERLLKKNTKYFLLNHGSNVIGNVADTPIIQNFCKKNNLLLILDVSQTLGSIHVDAKEGDILCFTGHKNLFGPQGTGGIILQQAVDFTITKTGGSGTNTFEKQQPNQMPDLFEVGTLNSHGIYGLQKGVAFINQIGIDKIHQKEMDLLYTFYNKIKNCENIKIYGNFENKNRLPIISVAVKNMTSDLLSDQLWQQYQIATRPGAHCAPLLHEFFQTQTTGLTRFSFSYFNTFEEIEIGAKALITIADEMKEKKYF